MDKRSLQVHKWRDGLPFSLDQLIELRNCAFNSPYPNSPSNDLSGSISLVNISKSNRSIDLASKTEDIEQILKPPSQ